MIRTRNKRHMTRQIQRLLLPLLGWDLRWGFLWGTLTRMLRCFTCLAWDVNPNAFSICSAVGMGWTRLNHPPQNPPFLGKRTSGSLNLGKGKGGINGITGVSGGGVHTNLGICIWTCFKACACFWICIWVCLSVGICPWICLTIWVWKGTWGDRLMEVSFSICFGWMRDGWYWINLIFSNSKGWNTGGFK